MGVQIRRVRTASSVVAAVAAIALLVPASAQADLVVDVDLGNLPLGITNIAGDTATYSHNNADLYAGITNTAGNWANEVVYQFTLTTTVAIDLTLNSAANDPDVFMLDGLTTALNGAKNEAQNGVGVTFLDGGVTERMGIFPPGTYYLSVDQFAGFDPPAGPFDTTFDIDVALSVVTPPAVFIDLGAIAIENVPFTIDSFGSSFDTELGAFDMNGFVILTNDDAGGTLQSELDFASGLAAGEYYVALGGFNTVYIDGFGATGGTSTGTWNLNEPLGSTQNGTLASGEIQWFRFVINVIPVELQSFSIE